MGKRKRSDYQRYSNLKKSRIIVDDSTKNEENAIDAENNWGLINGYLLWLNQFYAGSVISYQTISKDQFYAGRAISYQTISKELLRPLLRMVQKIDFVETSNVWVNSKLVIDVIKTLYSDRDITIAKACTVSPTRIGNVAYNFSKRPHFVSYWFNTDDYSTEPYSSDSDNRPSRNTVHAEKCTVRFKIGCTREETKKFGRMLEIQHGLADDDEWVCGWIINPEWEIVYESDVSSSEN